MITYAVKAKEDKVKRFNVFEENVLDYGDGWMGEPGQEIQLTRNYVGSTLAVSAEQAASRVAYRNGRKVTEVIPWAYDGCRTSTYVAEEE